MMVKIYVWITNILDYSVQFEEWFVDWDPISIFTYINSKEKKLYKIFYDDKQVKDLDKRDQELYHSWYEYAVEQYFVEVTLPYAFGIAWRALLYRATGKISWQLLKVCDWLDKKTGRFQSDPVGSKELNE